MTHLPKPKRKAEKLMATQRRHTAKHLEKGTGGSIQEASPHYKVEHKASEKKLKKMGKSELRKHSHKHSKEDLSKAHKHMKEHGG